jgi:signal transduction histidine kinase
MERKSPATTDPHTGGRHAAGSRRSFFGTEPRTTRYYVIVSLLLIALAVGALAFRSWQLSVQMERGLNGFAIQYLAYLAEVNARRTDAFVQSEFNRVVEQWHQSEREGDPSYKSLQTWVSRTPWLTSAFYLPDIDPENTLFVSSPREEGAARGRSGGHEFYTPTGTLRFTYDSERLVALARRRTEGQDLPRIGLPDAGELRHRSMVAIVESPRSGDTVVQTPDGISVVAPLGPPLSHYAVRTSISLGFVASSWQSQRKISIWLAIVAVGVVAAGAGLALRGVRRESEANQLRAALIANVSHELRTPLSMIRLGAETLKRSDRLKPEQRAALEESILREVVHLTHLVENVLDIARLQKSRRPLAFSTVNPAELIDSVITTYDGWFRSKGFTVETEIDRSIPSQSWDRESVSRAVLNLIDNAIKYSRDDKTVTVILESDGDRVVIGVRDHGIGIRQEDVTRIFNPYFRAEFSDTQTRRGAGLGLTLVQQIVASHSGTVEVESTPGVGSTFRLVFPASTEQASTAPAQEALNHGSAS